MLNFFSSGFIHNVHFPLKTEIHEVHLFCRSFIFYFLPLIKWKGCSLVILNYSNQVQKLKKIILYNLFVYGCYLSCQTIQTYVHQFNLITISHLFSI